MKEKNENKKPEKDLKEWSSPILLVLEEEKTETTMFYGFADVDLGPRMS